MRVIHSLTIFHLIRRGELRKKWAEEEMKKVTCIERLDSAKGAARPVARRISQSNCSTGELLGLDTWPGAWSRCSGEFLGEQLGELQMLEAHLA